MIIFGAGIRGKRCLRTLQSVGIEVSFFCDNNEKIWGKLVANIPVISPMELCDTYKETEILIANKNDFSVIRNQLLELGVENIKSLEEIILSHKRLSYLGNSENTIMKFTASENPILSIIIMNTNAKKSSPDTLGSILASQIEVPYEIVIWGGEATVVKGQEILFLKDGSMLQKGAVRELLELKREKGGTVGSKSVQCDGTINQAGYVITDEHTVCLYGHGESASRPEYDYVRNCDAVSISGMLTDAKHLNKIGEILGANKNFIEASIAVSLWMKDMQEQVLMQPFSLIVEKEVADSEHQIGSAVLIGVCREYLERSKFCRESIFWQANRADIYSYTLMADYGIAQFDRNAGNRSTYEYICILLELNVWMIYLLNDFYYEYEYIKIFQKKGIFVVYGEYWREHCAELLPEILSKIDYAFLNRPDVANAYIDIIRKYSDALVVHYGHDLHFLRLYREYEITGEESFLAESEKYKQIEYELVQKADITGYPSSVEVNILKKEFPNENIQLFPLNFFENRVYEREDGSREGILFVGGYGHSPNEDAAVWLVCEILPELRKHGIHDKVYLVGANPTQQVLELQREDVVVTGYVSETELDEYYEKCFVSVFPLRYGAGMKGKVLEALYKGIPVVTTDIGAEGLEDAGNILRVGNNVDEIVEKVVEIYYNKAELWSLGNVAHDYIIGHFGKQKMKEMIWKQIADSKKNN